MKYFYQKDGLLRSKTVKSLDEAKDLILEDVMNTSHKPEMVMADGGEVILSQKDIDYWTDVILGVPDPDPHGF